MMKPAPIWRRRLIADGLAGIALLFSGCVYLRLLAVKRQLADFDRNFTLQTRARHPHDV
jgi:hypothetical protein